MGGYDIQDWCSFGKALKTEEVFQAFISKGALNHCVQTCTPRISLTLVALVW